METFENVFQYPFSVIEERPFEMTGRWHEDYFKNANPIVLELGCGKGEYTVELARLFPEMNLIKFLRTYLQTASPASFVSVTGRRIAPAVLCLREKTVFG